MSRERLERLLVEELRRTWHSYNQLYLRGALSPPVLSLSEGQRRLGSWQRRSRTLSLSRELVWEHPWEDVCEVLKHEMAHQLAHEVLGARDERPHGPAFVEACRRLGISARASGPLEGVAEAGARASVVGRIRKLLALAGSSNEHEAEAAMRAAHRLMRRHNIDALDAEERRFDFRRVGPVRQRFEAWHKVRAGLLTRHFFVQAIWVRTWEARRGRAARQLELLGTPENLELAVWVHDFLDATGARLWRAHRAQAGLPGNKHRTRYLAGLMVGLDEKLSDEAADCEERGLVWVGDPALDAHVGARFPRLRSTRRIRVAADHAFGSGRADGRRLVLHRPVSEQPERRARQLTRRED